MNELAKSHEAHQVELPDGFLANLGDLALTDDSSRQIEDIIAEQPEQQEEQDDSATEPQDDAPELATDAGGTGLKPPTDTPGAGTAEMPEKPENNESKSQENIFEMLGAKAGSYKDHIVEAVGVIAARGEEFGDLNTTELTKVFDPNFTKDGRYHTSYKLVNKMEEEGLVEFELGAIKTGGRASDRIIATEKLHNIVDNNPDLLTSKKFYQIGKEAGLTSRHDILNFLVENYQNPENQDSETEE